MAWDEYYAVRSSNLYEHKGLAKPLLSLIALLIIGEPKENEQGQQIGERDPDAGYCTASQNYLAAQLGCSESDVLRWIRVFTEDGWLGVETYRNKLGHPRNKYFFPEGVLKKIQDRAMARDDEGKFIREKNPNKARKSSYRHGATRVTSEQTKIASRHGATRPDGSELPRLVAPSGKPGSSEPLELVLSSSREVNQAVAIANADANVDDRQTETQTVGETPTTPVFDSGSRNKSVSVQASAYCSRSSPTPTHDSGALPSREDEPACWLANYLFCFLSAREDVEVLPGWEKFWTEDFQGALDSGWSVEDLTLAVKASQVGRAREFYKRGASIVANLELLVELGQKLESKSLLCDSVCPQCHGLFIDVEALVEHQLDCGDKPVDPADAAEEEAMYAAEERASEGSAGNDDRQMYYPWPPDPIDTQEMYSPWAD